jgi:hypothetical protein
MDSQNAYIRPTLPVVLRHGLSAQFNHQQVVIWKKTLKAATLGCQNIYIQ